MAYVAVDAQGGLFPPDLLDRIAAGTAPRQAPADFGLGGARLSDEIQGAFSDARSFWDSFNRRRLHSRESLTTLTRETFVIPFLERLGFDLRYQRGAALAGGDSYAISHRAGDEADAPPVQIVTVGQPLDRRSDGARRSPHALVQEYLNRSDALWGLVTNGERLRLLRDSARITRPAYVEFDVRAIIEGNLYSEFVLLYRLLQRTRFPRGGGDAASCPLEEYYQQGIDEGGRVREHLRDGVEQALQTLGTAFLAHPDSAELREGLRGGQISATGYYRQLLRLVYRLLFLMVVEERRLLFPPDAPNRDHQSLYTAHYGIGRLRDRAERYFAEDHYGDLWLGLVQTFILFNDDDEAHELGLSALGGELFSSLACPDLEHANCDNAQLLAAIRYLSTFQDGAARRRVNYAALDVEELGSVYESLLEYQPHVELEPAPLFELVVGSERKQTGSYYTPPSLVAELVESALVPVLHDRFKGALTGEEREEAILGMRVCDTAMGSGHFLLAAARRMARELALVRSGEGEPTPEHFRQAVRDVIRRCVYGVDKNSLAVDLCKVALWIEGYNSGLPLNFLDNHIRHGDALVGVFDLAVLSEGVPDDAYTPVTGDDKKAAAAFKKRNRAERQGQTSYLGRAVDVSAGLSRDRVAEFAALALQDERQVRDEQAKSLRYEALRGSGTAWWTLKQACDLWTAAFFAPLVPAAGAMLDLVPTTETVRAYLAQPGAVYPPLLGQAVGVSTALPFFHWPLEFPEVFGQGAPGGFDVVLGNPPWDQIQPEEVKFFGAQRSAVARAIALTSGDARKTKIAKLPATDPDLYRLWEEHKRRIETTGKFARESHRFALTAVGKLNTYALFADLDRQAANVIGRTGVLVPTGIATDDSTKLYFQDIVDSKSLSSLFDFENREGLFPAVDSRMKFSLLTLAGPQRPSEKGAEFAFFAHSTDDLRDEEKRFTLTADDIALLNPNTHTCPIFRGKRDAELTKAIYRRSPVLINESTGENPWGVEFRQGLFNMTSDSGLFRTREQLLAEGLSLEGNVFCREGEDASYLPLYEAKLLHQFDHRWATYDGLDVRDLTDAEKADPTCAVMPRYWVPKQEVEEQLGGKWKHDWLVAFRRISNGTNERTALFSLLPQVGAGDSVFFMLPHVNEARAVACLVSNLNAVPLDYVVRQKMGGVNLNFYIVRQLPVLPPTAYKTVAVDYIAQRVLELVYTARDMAPFARDLGYDGPPFRWDPERRFRMRCELDALFFRLYGIERDDAAYIMDTFPIVAKKDITQYGEYRTKRVILEIYDELTSKGR